MYTCAYNYRNESTGNWRGVRVSEGKLQPPDGAWSETTVYNVVYPKGHSQGQYYVDIYRYLSTSDVIVAQYL